MQIKIINIPAQGRNKDYKFIGGKASITNVGGGIDGGLPSSGGSWLERYFTFNAETNILTCNVNFVSELHIAAFSSGAALPSIWNLLPIASEDRLGGIKLSDDFDIDSDGTLTIKAPQWGLPSSWYSDNDAIRAITGYSDGNDVGNYATLAIYEFEEDSMAVDDDDNYLLPDDITSADPGRWVKKKKLALADHTHTHFDTGLEKHTAEQISFEPESTSDLMADDVNEALNEIYGKIKATEKEIMTLEQAKTAMSESQLKPNTLYYISDWNMIFLAVNEYAFQNEGIRLMYCPATYRSTTDSHGNIWRGIWNSTLPWYDIDELVIWGGRVWRNVANNLGYAVNPITLNSDDWELVDPTSFTNNEYILRTFGCSFDWEEEEITQQWDQYNNRIIGTTNSAITNYENTCDHTDWNIYTQSNDYVFKNNLAGLIMNNIASAGINDNDTGTDFISGNIVSTSIRDNVCGAIMNNILNNGYIIENTNLGDIKNNICKSIERNSNKGEISGNSNIGYIEANSNIGWIKGNSNTNIYWNVNIGDIEGNDNTTEICYNSNSGVISNNTNNGIIEGNSGNGDIHTNSNNGRIYFNSNNGHIAYNSNGGHIEFNDNSGRIYLNSCSSNIAYNQNSGNISNNGARVSSIFKNKNAGDVSNNNAPLGYNLVIRDNANSGAITNNTNRTGIYNNINGGQIAYNSNTGSIYNNINAGEIAYNSNTGDISSNNNSGWITNNNNTGHIWFNSNTESIDMNSNIGGIEYNKCNGPIMFNIHSGAISLNNNNGGIVDNSGTGHIQYNNNNGFISGNVLSGNLSDTIVNKGV